MSEPFKTKVISASCELASTKYRPKDPVDLNFSLEEDNIPDGFFQADITVNSRRHLVFATEKQPQFFSKAKTWFINGTFKLCHHPFTQLWTINACVRCEDHMKQV